MKVQYIDRHTMTVKCDGIEYPIFDSNISIEDMQTIWHRWYGKKTIEVEWWLSKSPSYYMD